jgi:uncharacterized protein YciI
MLYIRLSFDRKDAGGLREQLRANHRAYVKPNVEPGVSCRVVQAGPLCITDTDDTNLASFMILEAANIDEVMHFHDNDPFTKAGLYEKSYIHRWDRHIG